MHGHRLEGVVLPELKREHRLRDEALLDRILDLDGRPGGREISLGKLLVFYYDVHSPVPVTSPASPTDESPCM